MTLRMRLFFICALSLNVGSANGATLEDLLAAGSLKADIVIETPAPYFARSPLVLAVEVATPRWFSRGTRVQDFRITGALVRPVSNFADNQTRRIDGESWSVQRWRFRVFAQEPGPLVLPNLRVSISVNTADSGVVDGGVDVSAPPLDIVAPPGTEDLADWVAAASVEIRQSWEGELEEHHLGDALTLVREYRISDAPAMVLAGTVQPQIPGISIYAAPPVVTDQTDRGRLVGRRQERIIFTFEEPGTYEIPGLQFNWFNTKTGEVETITLENRQIDVVGGAAVPSNTAPPQTRSIAWGLGMLVLAGLFLARHRIGRWAWVSRLSTRIGTAGRKRSEYRKFEAAAGDHNSARCIELLYAKSASFQNPRLDSFYEGELLSSLHLLMAHAYGNAPDAPNPGEIIALWNALDETHAHEESGPALRLNPAASESGLRSST